MREELYASDSWRTAQVSVCETRQEALGPFTQDVFLRSICANFCLHKHALYGRLWLLWCALLILCFFKHVKLENSSVNLGILHTFLNMYTANKSPILGILTT